MCPKLQTFVFLRVPLCSFVLFVTRKYLTDKTQFPIDGIIYVIMPEDASKRVWNVNVDFW